HADDAYQALDSGRGVAEAESGGGNAEHRVVRRVAEVRGQGEGAAAADAEPVDEGDARFGEPEQALEGLCVLPIVCRGRGTAAVLLELGDVGAGDEGDFAGAAEDDDTRRRVTL